MASLLRASPLAQLAEQSIASSVYDAAIIADQTSLQRFACFTHHQNAMDKRFYETLLSWTSWARQETKGFDRSLYMYVDDSDGSGRAIVAPPA